MGKKRTMSAETKDRLRGQKQAYKLRLKVERGTATAEDKERLVILERDFGAKKPRAAAKPPEPELDQEHEEQAPAEEPSFEPPSSPPPAGFEPPTEAPPKVEAPRGKHTGDWRAKYRSSATGGADDREATCVLAAQLMVVVPLKKATKYIIDGGSRPAFDDAFIDGPIRNLAVIVVDKYMPDGVALSPEMELGALGGTVLGQALMVWMRRSKEAKPATAPPKPPLKSVPLQSAPPPAPPPPPVAESRPVEPPVESSGPFIVKPDTLI